LLIDFKPLATYEFKERLEEYFDPDMAKMILDQTTLVKTTLAQQPSTIQEDVLDISQ